MKSFSRILTVALAIFAGAGPCLHRATAQTNGGEMQTPAPAVGDPRSLPQRREPGDLFSFPGGTPLEFITAAGNQFKVDWVGIATIPPDMGKIQVPKLRVPVGPPDQLLKLYNRLGEQNPTLGKWVWEGPANSPTVLMLVPSGNKNTPVVNLPEPPMEVRVFLLGWISGTNLITAAEALKAVDDVAQRNARAAGQTPVPNRVVIDQRTSSLILSGSREYINMASNILMRMDIPSEESPPTIKALIPPAQSVPGQPAPRGRQ